MNDSVQSPSAIGTDQADALAAMSHGMHSHTIHPNAVLSASLVLSLLLWIPSAQACVAGDLTLAIAAVRYVVGFLFVRVAVGGFVHLVHHYRTIADHTLAHALHAEHEQRRRASDLAGETAS